MKSLTVQSVSRRSYYQKLAAIFLLMFVAFDSANAHTVVTDLENMSSTGAAFVYLKLGYRHILPLGFDHILFVLSLFLLNPKLKPVLWQATAFTVAHTITLGLSMYHVIKPPANIVEPMIAASIMYVAIENILSNKLRPARIGIVFLFGLVHGMGFASVLGQLGLPRGSFLSSLLMFNLGVELGQITVILAAYFLLAKWFKDKPWYRSRIVIPLSVVITLIAFYWLIQRLFF